MKRQWMLLVFFTSGFLAVGSASPRFPNGTRKLKHTVAIRSRFGSREIDDDTSDEPKAPLKITEMRVHSRISLRYARTAIVARVTNPDKRPQQAKYQVLLPDTAFISGFTMILGKESYDAFVKEKEEAKVIYDKAVAQGIGAAHITTKARDSNHFTISFNLEGHSNATYRLTYEEFLVRRNGLYNHAINLNPGSLVPKMEIVVHIKESQKISLLRVPEIKTGNEIEANENAQNSQAVIRRGADEQDATITFTPDLIEQKRLAKIYMEKSDQLSGSSSLNSFIGYDSEEEEDDSNVFWQFIVQYDVHQPKTGEILVNDGYFVHLFAPDSLPTLSKYVVFVLDTSGSMTGRKIEQLRNAMDAILSDLNPNDYFNIVEFNSETIVHDLKEANAPNVPERHMYNERSSITWVPPAIASPENIAKAKIIVSRLTAKQATDINTALIAAINLVKKGVPPKDGQNSLKKSQNNSTENELEPIIIFLTDGEPTVGEIDVENIVTYVTERNAGNRRASLYTLAFGEDADRNFLRRLSLRNEGFMRHIYEAADASLQLQDFYRQVSSPLLSHVKFQYPQNQIKEESVSRTQFRTINAGSEVAVAGRLADDATEITPQVFGLRGDDNGRSRKRYEVNSKAAVVSDKNKHLPLERLWAYLTIKQLLDKRDSEDNHRTDEESPEKKALAIALKYSFVTPLTSLVVVRLNESDHLDVESLDEPDFLGPLLSGGTSLIERYTTTRLTLLPKDGPALFAELTQHYVASGISDIRVSGLSSNAEKLRPSPGTVLGNNLVSYRGGGGYSGHDYNARYDRNRGDGEEYGHGQQNNRGGGGGGFVPSSAASSAGVLGANLVNPDSRGGDSPGGIYGLPNLETAGGFGRKDSDKKPVGTHSYYAETIRPINKSVLPGLPLLYHNKIIRTPSFSANDGRIINIPFEKGVKTTTTPGPSTSATSHTTEVISTTNKYENLYHLNDYSWVLSLINNSAKALVFSKNGHQVILQLSTDPYPPSINEGECSNSSALPFATVADVEESQCVYLTRCYAARNITVDVYLQTYCYISNYGYAGICCPKDAIDKQLYRRDSSN